MIIDKDIHSFIVFETVIFINIHCAQLIGFFFSLASVVLPASGPSMNERSESVRLALAF